MRWKLLLISSLLATIAGAGTSLGLAYMLGLASAESLRAPSLPAFATLLFPVATCVFASIFVYRHTARRRSLQAMATALLVAALTLAAFTIAFMFLSRPTPIEPRPPVRTVG